MPRRMGVQGEVSVLEAITSYSDVSPTYFLVVCACVIAATDVGCAIALYGEVHRWEIKPWWPLAILRNTWDAKSFSRDSADILLLVIARLSILPAVALLAATKGKPPDTAIAQRPGGTGQQAWRGERKATTLWRRLCSCLRRSPDADHVQGGRRRRRGLLDIRGLDGGDTSTTGDDATLSVPLLAVEDEPGNKQGTATPDPSSIESGDGGNGDVGNGERVVDDQALERAKDVAKRKKNILLFLVYSISTAMQVYTGVKCVGFKFKKERVEGFLLGLGVVWVNALVWALTQLVAVATREEGILEPALHPHRLYPGATPGRRCDICRERIKPEDGRAWRCNLCDYDLCRSCFEKKDRRSAEGAIRGDKGLREESELQTMGYFRRALGLAKPHWPYFALAFVCLAVSKSATIALPNFEGGILDRVFHRDVDGFRDYVILFVILSFVKSTIGGVQSMCFRLAGLKMSIGARNKLFRGVISQDVAFFEATTSGKLTSRLTSDVQAMVAPCTFMLGSLFSNIMLLIGGVVMCFLTSWRLSVLAFTAVGPIYHITRVYAMWSKRLNVEIYVAFAEANGFATEALGNVRTVKAMSTEHQEMNKFNEATGMALEKGTKDALGSALTAVLSNYLNQGGNALILWYGGRLAMDGGDRMTAGQLVTYQLYCDMISSAWQGLLSVVSRLTRAAGAAQRVFSLMDSMPDIDIDKGLVIDDKDFRGDIRLQGVEFTYQMRPDNPVLRGVDLNIPAGTTCALVGRSGSGKTTLVHLILRFYDPRAGRILIDGVPLTDLQLRSLHRKMAIVAQDTQLFEASVYDNITYGMQHDEFTEADVYEAARLACAHDFISAFSDGYKTKVGERGTRLSGGQKQRVAIARALLRKPRILLLDEATSALDAESEASVQQALDTLVEKGAGTTTVVLVAHRLSTVMNAQNIAVMDKGICTEQGTHEELMGMGGVYSSLVARQISRAANTLQQETHGESQSSADIDMLMDELDGKKATNGKRSVGSKGGSGRGEGRGNGRGLRRRPGRDRDRDRDRDHEGRREQGGGD